MRILHWYPNLLRGGAVAASTARLARSQNHAGAEILIAAAKADGVALYGGLGESSEIVGAWRPAWHVEAGGLVLRGLRRVDRQRLRAFRPEVVHVHGEFNPDNLWVPRLFRVPLVLSPRGAFHPVVLATGKARAKRLYLGVARRALYRHVASFHATSPLEADHIRAICPGVPVYVLPLGVPPVASASPQHNDSSRRRTRVEFVFIGRLDVFTKGLDLLLDAFREVSRRSPVATHLTLVGPDWRGGKRRLEERAEGLRISALIDFVGEATADAVMRYLEASDVCAQVSRHEGFSQSSLEALLAGKPLVMTTGTGLASYQQVASLPHVLVVPPQRDAIAGALLDVIERLDELTRAASAAQPEVASFFSSDRIGREHLDVYRRLAPQRGVEGRA